MLFTMLLALAPNAFADECDARALQKEAVAAAPVKAAPAFVALANCDKAKAKAVAPKVLPNMLSGSEGNQASVSAIEVGANADLRTWLNGLEPDQRSRTVAFLGEKCGENESIQGFFAESAQEMGTAFWTERWHRGLAECRAEGIQKLLSDALNDPELSKDRTRLFNVLEVYARNLRGNAVPTLVNLASKTTDPEELTYLVNAFADTTGIGSEAGVDAAVASEVIKSITALGPMLPPQAVEQARITLRALDDEQASASMAKYRWKDRLQDGQYRYAVAITEIATCKNQKTKAALHTAKFTEPGDQWPDQLQPLLQEKLTYDWMLQTAETCKGEAEFIVAMPPEPLESEEAQEQWLAEQISAFQDKAETWDKAKSYKQETFGL